MTISGYRVGYNTLDTALPADNQGRVIAGREYDLVLATSPQVRAAAAREALVLLPADLAPSGGTADAVLARFATVEANAEALNPYDRQVLADLADTVDVDTSDGPNKAELVARLAVLDPQPPLPPLEGGTMGGAAPEPPMAETVAAVPHTPAGTPPGEPVAHTPAGEATDAAAADPPSSTTRPAARKAASSTRKAH